jgi:diacylglycerol kinase family enzyme
MKWLAIANPAAGRAREPISSGRLRDLRGVNVGSCGPRRRAIQRLARESSAFDGVIAIGGDGTIEVLQGIDLSRQCLAVLPAGHGMCLARDLGVADPVRALAALRHGACRPLDLMDVSVGYVDGRQDRRLRLSFTRARAYAAAAHDRRAREV